MRGGRPASQGGSTGLERPDEVATLSRYAEWTHHWLVQHAFPVWLEKGTDWRDGGFFDALSPSTLKNAADIKRLRVLTRQIYAFSRAAHLDVPGAADAVQHGLRFLLGPARLARGCFASRFSLDGRILGEDVDLYDHAFVLFALAHSYELLRESVLLEEAQAVLDVITNNLRHPAGGFVEGVPACLPRRQNPHMHLLEACLAWLPHDQSMKFAQVADEIVMLFERFFFQPQEGVLVEYFDENLRPAPVPVVEPGHHFEWVWLLRQYEGLKESGTFPVERLMHFAIRKGIDRRTGFLFGEVSPKGHPITPSCRVWPHTEWLKAELSTLTTASTAAVARALRRLQRYLDIETKGLWHERWDPTLNAFVEEPCPASSLYHIVLSFSELARLADSSTALNRVSPR
jgi:mannose-6-phosphate isomerase